MDTKLQCFRYFCKKKDPCFYIEKSEDYQRISSVLMDKDMKVYSISYHGSLLYISINEKQLDVLSVSNSTPRVIFEKILIEFIEFCKQNKISIKYHTVTEQIHIAMLRRHGFSTIKNSLSMRLSYV